MWLILGFIKTTMQPHPPDERDDAGLLALLRQGDLKAFEDIYLRYWRRLYVAAYKVLEDEAASKDILQEVFLDIWNRRSALDIQYLNAYLYQAVKFQIAKQLRKRPINPVHLDLVSELESKGRAEDGLLYDDLNKHLEVAISHLSPRCQQVFRLSRYEFLSNKEIGQRLNISISTVENQINIALKALRAHLNDELIFLLLCCLFHD